MTKEQEEVINNLEQLINIRKNKAGQIKYDNCICSTTAIETILNMLKEKDKEIKKKDKIIDLLVNKLNQDCKVFENGEIKEIVEIYEKIKSTSDLRGIELRKECIKQYFERKATNDG